MHAGEINADVAVVKRLVVAQFPQWAELPIEPVKSAGTDNAIFMLGEEMSVRLPRISSAAEQVEKEHVWLPRFAPVLPLAIPVPLAKGVPSEDFPWTWSVYSWLEGDNAIVAPISDLEQAARDVAQFIATLQRIDSANGPLPGEHNFFRGASLASRDLRTRDAIRSLDGLIDTIAVNQVWTAALDVPPWQDAPRWIHGDIQAGNLIVEHDRVSGIIDFGGLGVGDPACDLMIAWTLFSGDSREAFRAALSVDDATWARGRGWALSVALIALPYYLNTNPTIVRAAQHTIEAVISDNSTAA